MDRLSILMTLMTGAVLTGALVTTLFSLGFYGWPAVLGAAGLGYLAAWPVAWLISRRIKRRDPNWASGRAKGRSGPLPAPSAPEV